LVAALLRADVRALTTIPGVGKKTAERMVLELKDKVRELAGPETPTVHRATEDDLVAALVNLGYKPATAEQAVAQVEKDLDGFASKPFADKLRAALRKLSRV
jgi:Holliday junction DNA helicase RuvA